MIANRDEFVREQTHTATNSSSDRCRRSSDARELHRETLADDAVGDASTFDSTELKIISQMMLFSLTCYQELADLAGMPWLHEFAQEMVTRRGSQTQELLHLAKSGSGLDGRIEEIDTKFRLAWRLAIWNLEQGQILRLAEFASQAERMLEQSFIHAAGKFECDDRASLLFQHAISVRNARKLWHEIQIQTSSVPASRFHG